MLYKLTSKCFAIAIVIIGRVEVLSKPLYTALPMCNEDANHDKR